MSKTPTLAHPPVDVNAQEFFDAVARIPKMRRGPVGAKGVIPKDTRLLASESGVMVETSVMSSLVFSSQPWRINVEVDAHKLIDVCTRFKKIGVFKNPNSIFSISVADNQLKVKWQTTAISVPLFR